MGPATAESRTAPRHAPVPVSAAIQADGTSVGSDPEWLVHKTGTGEYVLAFGRDVRVDVQSWDAAATVTLRPSSARTWVVAFVQGSDPVDSAFSFSAVPPGP